MTFRCADYLANFIEGGGVAITDQLPLPYLKRYRKILIKYNLIYQEQFISADGSSLCSWKQFRQRPFAAHINTQVLPKFYQALSQIVTNEQGCRPNGLTNYDYDAGRILKCPSADLYLQALQSVPLQDTAMTHTAYLKPLVQLDKNPYYSTSHAASVPLSLLERGYPWAILPHPVTDQLTIGRVYTRNLDTNEAYMQHYMVAPNPIDTYPLKSTRRNSASKGAVKYSNTVATSAILACPGCQLHDASTLVKANRRANRNFRSPPHVYLSSKSVQLSCYLSKPINYTKLSYCSKPTFWIYFHNMHQILTFFPHRFTALQDRLHSQDRYIDI